MIFDAIQGFTCHTIVFVLSFRHSYMMLCLSIINSSKLNLMSHKIEEVSVCSDV